MRTKPVLKTSTICEYIFCATDLLRTIFACSGEAVLKQAYGPRFFFFLFFIFSNCYYYGVIRFSVYGRVHDRELNCKPKEKTKTERDPICYSPGNALVDSLFFLCFCLFSPLFCDSCSTNIGGHAAKLIPTCFPLLPPFLAICISLRVLFFRSPSRTGVERWYFFGDELDGNL